MTLSNSTKESNFQFFFTYFLITAVHTQEKNYTCFICGAQFARSDHHKRHLLIHEEPKHKCDVCSMSFRRSDKLLIHRRRHTELMNYTCENCNLGFMDISSIKTHINFHCKAKPGGTSTAFLLNQAAETIITTPIIPMGESSGRPLKNEGS